MTTPEPTPRRAAAAPGLWRGLLLGYLFIGALWLAARRLPEASLAFAAAAVLALALPMGLALWHQHGVRKLVALRQFAPGRGLHRLARRRTLGMLWRALLALLLAAATLVQSAFFTPREWLLLALAPALLAALRHAAQARAARQFRAPLYGLRWSLWLAAWGTALLLTGLWIALRLAGPPAPEAPAFLDHVHRLQSRWSGAQPGLLVWALDLAAWGQATVAALDGLDGGARPGWWRSALALLVAPLALFGHLAFCLAGLGLPRAELRRMLGAPLSAATAPPPLPPGRAALWSALAVVAVMLWFQTVAQLNAVLRPLASPFAIAPLPDCERIGGQAYRLNTSRLLDSLLAESRERLATQQALACGQLEAVARAAQPGVDAYLDWYFSLGAEWSRIATLLTGDIELLLQTRFQQLVLANPALAGPLQALQQAHEAQWRALDDTRGQAIALLERKRLVLDERGCRATQVLPAEPWAPSLDATRARLTAGSAAGLVAGAIAAKITAKAMGKASVKAAGKLLLKASAKKAVGKGAATAAGAAIGSVVPGVGTVVGAIAGLAIGTAVDLAALAVDERLNRADMRRELLDAVTETLQPYRTMFGCG